MSALEQAKRPTPATIDVSAAAGAYRVVIGRDLLDEADVYVRQAAGDANAVLIVADRTVAALGYAQRVEAALSRAFARVATVVVPAGESSKSFAQATELYGECVRAGLDRKSLIVALGGGVVGDLAGFVAATFMRGVDFVQMPTTLLAHDSSIGGKVGVNLPEGKNLVGAFHAPRLVLYDVAALQTLPRDQVASGLAEAVKHGVIRDPELFGFIESAAPQLLECSPELMTELLLRSCRVKVDVIQVDERETGLRAILNFGHTVGHAVEAQFYGELQHGAAVAIGMVAETRLARALGMTDAAFEERLIAVLRACGLPTEVPDLATDPDVEEQIVGRMRLDKKGEGRNLAFVLPRGLGEIELVRSVDEPLVRAALRASR